MEIIIPTPEQAEFMLRSLKTVVLESENREQGTGNTFYISTQNSLRETQNFITPLPTQNSKLYSDRIPDTPRALLEAAQKHLLMSQYDLDRLEPIEPEILAQAIVEPNLRLQLIQAMVILILSTGNIKRSQLQKLECYAKELQVPSITLKNIRQLYQRRFISLSLNVYFRCFIAQKYKYELSKQGWGWFLKGLINYLGIIENREIANRYRQLEFFPETTLGYQFWKFCTERGYSFPGEKGGNHENLCFHDVTHVLGGYDTSPEGELQVVAMTVGYKKNGDPLASLFFILLQQHLGIQVGLLSKAKKGVLDLPGGTEKFIKAFKRGATMTVDLSENWDHWTAFAQPVDLLRKQYNII